jgi:hypothetical protein
MNSLFAAACAASALAASSALAWAPTVAAERDLKDGRPVSEVEPAPDDAVLIHAAIDIPAPPKVVWTVMNDCAKANRIIVTVTSCKILQSDPAHGTETRETVTKGNFFVPTIYNIVREDLQPYSSIRFRKAGGNLRQEQGEWRLLVLSGGAGTRLIYENLVGADILAPPSLVRAAMRHDVAKVMTNIRTEAVAAAKPPG